MPTETRLTELAARIVMECMNYQSMDFNIFEQEEHDQRVTETADRIRPYFQAADNEIIRLNGLLRVAHTERNDAEKALTDSRAEVARQQKQIDNLLKPMLHRVVDRLDVLVGRFVDSKWSDVAQIADWKPEDKKYITQEDLIAAIDAELKGRP